VTPPAALVHGAVVAVVEIVDVLTKPEAAAFAPWFFGPYGFVLQHQDASDAGAGRGGVGLGLPRAPDDLRRRVARALRSAVPH
jgi:hypothetical protein